MNATYSRAIRASQGQSKMPESGFAEESQSTESGGAASGGCLPIISGLRRRVSRVKLKIRRSWDPFFGVPRPFGSMAQGECWIPDHVWLP
ncbi:hypothetical protein DL98DRAFT_522778, partial [Cadophora sp. DSE1049]